MKYRTIVKKDLPYLPLFKSDWLSSKKVRRCSASTRGIYADLLCVLHDEERHGCYSLHLQEEKWRKSRSKTNLALAKPDGYQRLPYFAEFLSRRIGDTKSVILKALKELYERKIIVVEGDSLIQPRMYMDSEYELLPETVEWLAQSEDHDIVMEPVTDDDSDDTEEGDSKGGKKTSKKTIKKMNEKSRTRTDAYATRTESGSENKNIDVSKGNIGGVGETPKGEDKPKQSSKGKTDAVTPADVSKKTDAVPVADCPPTLDDVKAYMQESGELGRIFRYITAEEYYDEGCKNGWRQRNGQPLYDWKAQLRSYEAYRRDHGDQPVSQRQKAKAGEAVRQKAGKDYNDW